MNYLYIELTITLVLWGTSNGHYCGSDFIAAVSNNTI